MPPGDQRKTKARLIEEVDDLRRRLSNLEPVAGDLVEAREALRRSEERCRLLAENTSDVIWTTDLSMRTTYVSPAVERMLGYTVEEFVGQRFAKYLVPASLDTAKQTLREVRALVRDGMASVVGSRTLLLQCLRKDGEKVWVEVTATLIRDCAGQPIGIHGVTRNVTRRRKAEEALEESQARFRALFDRALYCVYVHDLKGKLLDVNETALNLLGYTREEILGMAQTSLLDEEQLARALRAMKEILEFGAQRTATEIRLRRKTGEPVWVATDGCLIHREGKPYAVIGLATDITERKRAEVITNTQRDLGVALSANVTLPEAIRLGLEAAMRVGQMDCGGLYLMDDSTGGIDLAFHTGLSSEFVRAVSRYGPDAPQVRMILTGWPFHATHKELASALDPPLRREGLRVLSVIPLRYKGQVFGCLNVASHTLEEVPATARDVLEATASHLASVIARLKAEEALRQSESRLDAAINNLPFDFWILDRSGRYTIQNRVSRDLWGNLIGKRPEDAAPDSPTLATWMENNRRAFRGEVVRGEVEMPVHGEKRHFYNIIAPIEQGDEGVRGILGLNIDITERKILEQELRQAQKMEAVGQLAGGIAHDFNNLMTGILGHASLLKLWSEPGTRTHDVARTIERATERAADLTEQLLGFARRGKHQVLPVDLHSTVHEVINLLSRTLHKNIRITLDLQAESSSVMGDPVQMQQVLLNLALNARDAMPQGGELAFRTDVLELSEEFSSPHLHVPPGRYLVVSVADTGHGIPGELKGRIFEPFFTTKAKGEGTGMGLAMVYGIVKNHGGCVEVTSEVGEGATFSVYLPLMAEDPVRTQAASGDVPVEGSGRILLVDDEEVVRDVARDLIEALGYEVVVASSGKEALDIYATRGEEIDLVIIDMIMPEMDGRDCFHALRRINPNVRAMLSTGYVMDGKAQEILDEGMTGFLKKPYDLNAMGRSIQAALREKAKSREDPDRPSR